MKWVIWDIPCLRYQYLPLYPIQSQTCFFIFCFMRDETLQYWRLHRKQVWIDFYFLLWKSFNRFSKAEKTFLWWVRSKGHVRVISYPYLSDPDKCKEKGVCLIRLKKILTLWGPRITGPFRTQFKQLKINNKSTCLHKRSTSTIYHSIWVFENN